jgi:2-iminobutanoate/2-iminopropanoate deaminase
MERTTIMRPDAKNLTDPFSYGVRWGDLLFVSGQSPAFDAVDFDSQTRSVLEKLGVVLRLAGTDYPYVLRCGVYLRDMTNFGPFNRIYREFFPKDFPARTTLECKMLSDRILVAVDCVAGIPAKSSAPA